MRVLFLLTQSLTNPSGLGRYWPLARQMARLGYEVEIAALHPAWSSLDQRRFTRDGVAVTYVGQMHVRQQGDRRTYFTTPQLFAVTARATIALAQAGLRSRADVIHIAKAQPMNGLAGWLAARLARRRLYLDCDDDEAASNRFGAGWQKSVVRRSENWLPKTVRGVTVNTRYLQDRCARLGVAPSRIRWVPNGFDPDRFQPPAACEVEAVRERWQLQGRPVILYIGSINLSNHPVLLLLDAFVLVQKAIPSACLVVVGGGADYDRLTEAIRERALQTAVVLAGRVDPLAVASIYAASDVVVDPVLDDDAARARSPLKIVESFAMGVPVVTGDVGDRAEMLGGGQAGVLVRPGCAQALAAGILQVLGEPAQATRFAEHARKRSEAYRWDRLVHQFVSVYDL